MAPNFPPRRILLAVESAELAQVALEQVAPLVKSSGAVVDLVNVWEPVPFTPPDAAYYHTGAIRSYRDIANEEGAAHLSRLAEHAAKLGVAIGQQDVREGAPAQSLISAIEDHRADLVVLTTHQRHGARRWLQGSVSQKVAQRATCPVLVVPIRAQA